MKCKSDRTKILNMFCSYKHENNDHDHAELRAPIFQNQGSFPRALSLKRSWCPQIVLAFSNTIQLIVPIVL